ncbi:alpha/beta fold hydrolase [Curtobacterium sp. VKM Ac-2922]|uniref:alpha/beta fold hydrolase n=1 Tax=Curtobacterium sp. VKM Ac-2922 TaxID=2929475 RepID=UPI001FB43E34|nr:alpha/beta hydrolase [Curtobacterium sp. VKM Ac-2922]MCJ1712782.1 alpha/beta fold hydrolase [Curtobacterium sp. VKM Ac-2922]
MTAPVDRTVVSADGTVLAVSEAGAGPAVVIVGGAFHHRGTPYVDRLVDLLAADHRVITYDRRGRGASGDSDTWAIERESDDFRAVVESADAPVTTIGICVGVGVVLHGIAAGAPVDGAVLWEPPYRASVDPHAEDVVFADVLDEHVAAGRRGAALRAYLAQVIGMPMGQIAGLRLKSGLWRTLLADAHVLPRDVRMLNGLAIPERVLASVGVPVLVASGTESPDWMAPASRAAVEAIPGSVHVTVPGQAHVPDAEVLASLLDRARTAQH